MKKLSENCNSLYYVTFSWLKKMLCLFLNYITMCEDNFWESILNFMFLCFTRSWIIHRYCTTRDTYNRIRMKCFVNQICIKNRNTPSKNDITHCAQTKEQSRYLILMIFIFLRSVWIFAAGGVTTSSITVTAYILWTVRS